MLRKRDKKQTKVSIFAARSNGFIKNSPIGAAEIVCQQCVVFFLD
jgi:hypothetical protein